MALTCLDNSSFLYELLIFMESMKLVKSGGDLRMIMYTNEHLEFSQQICFFSPQTLLMLETMTIFDPLSFVYML